jgi:hypothetical protein
MKNEKSCQKSLGNLNAAIRQGPKRVQTAFGTIALGGFG